MASTKYYTTTGSIMNDMQSKPKRNIFSAFIILTYEFTILKYPRNNQCTVRRVHFLANKSRTVDIILVVVLNHLEGIHM